MPVDTLLALRALRDMRRVETAEVAAAVQKPLAAARAVLERLVEAGLVKPHGQGRGRTYTLSPKVYRTLGQDAGYVRQAGFDRIQQEQMVLSLAQQKGDVRRQDIVDLCQISPSQASRLLRDLAAQGRLVRSGRGKGSVYERS